MPDWQAISAALEIGEQEPVAVSGGDISAAWRLGDLFVKTGPLSAAAMFAAEARGLAEIAATGTVRVPQLVRQTEIGDASILALEWLQLGMSDAATERQLGEQLAAMHRHTQAQFGWYCDNTIGLTPQPNTLTDDWVDFLREHRLQHQLRLAREAGFAGRLQVLGERLLQRLPSLFAGVDVVPSLLHGDLWSGNRASCAGEPVLFDPAVYYGDRETDLAMSRLFGGFAPEYYAAYDAAWPLADGAADRVAVYQLYHVLNHLNLFGGGYYGRAVELMAGLV